MGLTYNDKTEKAFNTWRIIEPCARIYFCHFSLAGSPWWSLKYSYVVRYVLVTLRCDVSPGWSLLADLRCICVNFEIAVQEHSCLTLP